MLCNFLVRLLEYLKEFFWGHDYIKKLTSKVAYSKYWHSAFAIWYAECLGSLKDSHFILDFDSVIYNHVVKSLYVICGYSNVF